MRPTLFHPLWRNPQFTWIHKGFSLDGRLTPYAWIQMGMMFFHPPWCNPQSTCIHKGVGLDGGLTVCAWIQM
jgi:hypothetical protein